MNNKYIVYIIILIESLTFSAYSQNKAAKNIELSRLNAELIKKSDMTDNSDLQFLKNEIKDSRIVWLGENSHSIKDNNVFKYRLIRFLYEEMEFDVVIFESGISNCALSNIAKKQLNPFELLYTSLIGYWRTLENCDLMEFFLENTVQLSGMDPNYKARYLPKKGYFFIFSENEKIAEQYFKLDSIGSYYYLELTKLFHSNDKRFKIEYSKELIYKRDFLINGYNDLLKSISLDDLNSNIREEKTLKLLKFSLRNNIIDLNKDITQYDNAEAFWVTNSERDSLMAYNLSYLVDSIYTENKIIVWAHNMHIKNDKKGINKHPNMFNTISYYLPKHIKKSSFIIGIYSDLMKKNCSKNSVFRISRELEIGSYYLNLKNVNKNTFPQFWANNKMKTCNDSKIYIFGELYDAFIYLPNSEESKLLNYDPYKLLK